MHPILAGAAESMKASITIVTHFQKKKKKKIVNEGIRWSFSQSFKILQKKIFYLKKEGGGGGT
jgi:hypothetical protein